jgi:hypothetical protein
VDGISIIIPCDRERIPLLQITLEKYLEFDMHKVEILIVTRTIESMEEIIENELLPIRLIKYNDGGPYFNPARALNLGVSRAYYDNIIITGPEVKPITNIIEQFKSLPKGNYVCQVFDLNQDGSIRLSLVNKNFRGDTPGFCFLAMYRKEDIIAINGWDEQFCDGKAYEDEDFGKRWVRAGIPFEVREDIQANHQWHLRNDVKKGLEINKKIMDQHDSCGLIRAERGFNLYE